MTALLCLCGCRGGFVGGLDDGNMQFGQLVLINRSSHDVSMTFKLYDNDSIYRVALEPDGDLWKRTSKEQKYGCSFDWAEVTFDDGRKICYDYYPLLPHNPCFGGTRQVHDSRGNYIIYEFSDKAYKEVMDAWKEIQTFEMFSLTPSVVVDSLCVPGSSEAIFEQLYPVGEVKNHLKLGAAVKTEADRIDLIEFDETRDVIPEKTATRGDHHLTVYQKVKAYYYSIGDLRKMGLAHFGCDFAALTGRGETEMDRFSGIMAVRAHVDRCEYIDEEDPAFESSPDLGFIDQIYHGQLMILLAEADCSANALSEHVEHNLLRDLPNEYLIVENVDFYLITLDSDGVFQCVKGGEELVDIYLGEVSGQPIFPIAFTLAGDAGIHIPDVTF